MVYGDSNYNKLCHELKVNTMKSKISAYFQYYFTLCAPFLIMSLLTGIVCISLKTFNPEDVSFFYHATSGVCKNSLGYFGATLAACLVYCFGICAYFIPGLLLYSLPFFARRLQFIEQIDRIIGSCGCILLASGMCKFYAIGYYEFSGCGGWCGSLVMSCLSSFDNTMKSIILWALLFASSILMSRMALLRLIHRFVMALIHLLHYAFQVDNVPAKGVRAIAFYISIVCLGCWRMIVWGYQLFTGTMVQNLQESIMNFEHDQSAKQQNSVDQDVDSLLQDLFGKESVAKSEKLESNDVVPINSHFEASDKSQDKVKGTYSSVNVKQYVLPDVDKMLSFGHYEFQQEYDNAEMVEQSAILEEKLSLFGIRGKVVRIHPGPVITLFEYKPDNHIKLSRIIGLEDDLAMALQALNIRILAPIPGKDVVGFEVANKVRLPVQLSHIFHGTAWTKFKGHLPLIIGEDTYGNHVVVDLTSMPHVLIAGSTGSGKSVALNCMLVSLLCAKKTDELKLIIIDPKQIEFTAYERIAHLLFPVVTDSKKALPVLKWVVMTMEERYQRMAELGVKNIFEYQKLRQEQRLLEAMPFIVVIIDELADLMMTTGKDTEDLITRIAQMSRAAGIHMIVATQRPSVDVITGLIKVNFPNRISFKVTSKIDSRTILDESGAERLLGKGDMLFIDAKDPQIRRVHGAYVSEKEVHYLVKHIEAQQPPSFLDVADIFVSDSDTAIFESDHDLYQEVVDMLKDCEEVSISMIQRRFRIGYNRSARIVETLEARGLVMSSDGGKMRRVIKD